MEYWTTEGLSVVASGVGKPLYSDTVTKQCSRLDYARVCVMLDYNSTLPKHLVIISPIPRDGKEVPVRVDIDYEWLPQRCKECQSLGHNANSCPDKKKLNFTKPVEVYVQKARSMAEVVIENEVEHRQQLEVGQSLTVDKKDKGISFELNKQELISKGESSKGKDIVLYNQFDILHNDNLGVTEDPISTADMNTDSTGPIQSNPLPMPP
ncbi:UNVERIFIED_CONTAM: hypothetical protein Sangu_3220100 [Sesamum angustifolium]|uniref:Zinc knuckle CX2CX4HX4C domain-containing protein n=1 Tax=Sesamum angustifolium TaxID=2727405 RepID=A0AAW2JLA1_9LAMI